MQMIKEKILFFKDIVAEPTKINSIEREEQDYPPSDQFHPVSSKCSESHEE